jgi:hypothetical protein
MMFWVVIGALVLAFYAWIIGLPLNEPLPKEHDL